MRDDRWISYFRRVVFATMALPACGGTIGEHKDIADGGSDPTGHVNTPQARDGMAPVSPPATGFPTPLSPATSACNLFEPSGSACIWARNFAGACSQLAEGDGGPAMCLTTCGMSIAMQTADSCQVRGCDDAGCASGYVHCTSNSGLCRDGGVVFVGNGGRRPGYFASLGFGPAAAGREIGTHFARAACLEAASVEAFRSLRSELLEHGAPRRLVRATSRAIRDEMRHVRQTSLKIPSSAACRLASRQGTRRQLGWAPLVLKTGSSTARM
jgi:hypothetical protein